MVLTFWLSTLHRWFVRGRWSLWQPVYRTPRRYSILRRRRLGFLLKLINQPEESVYRRLMFGQAEGQLTCGRKNMSTAASYAEDLKKHDIHVSKTPYLQDWISKLIELTKTVAFDWTKIEGELL